MPTSRHDAYRFEQLMLFIEQHLYQPLTTRQLADRVHWAYFHFHHRFTQQANEPVWQLVKRLRLERAAFLLTYTKMTVADIADEVGYGSSASLSKAFRLYHGRSPTAFRDEPKPLVSEGDARFLSNYTSPRLVRLPPQALLFVRATGPDRHSQAWRQLRSLQVGDSSWPSTGAELAPLGKTPDMPGLTPTASLRYDLGLVLPQLTPAPLPTPTQPLLSQLLPGGKYAVLTHQGPVDTLPGSLHALFNQWLAQGDYRLRHAPFYQRYQPRGLSDGNGPAEIAIYLPIE